MKFACALWPLLSLLYLSPVLAGSLGELRDPLMDAANRGDLGSQEFRIALASPAPERRALAVRLLGQLRRPETFDLVAPLLKAPLSETDSSVIAAACFALGQLGFEAAPRIGLQDAIAKLLMDTVQTQSGPVRTTCLYSAGKLSTDFVFAALPGYFADADPQMRRAALRALYAARTSRARSSTDASKFLYKEDARDKLLALANDPSSDIRRLVATNLSRPQAVRRLRSLSNSISRMKCALTSTALSHQ